MYRSLSFSFSSLITPTLISSVVPMRTWPMGDLARDFDGQSVFNPQHCMSYSLPVGKYSSPVLFEIFSLKVQDKFGGFDCSHSLNFIVIQHAASYLRCWTRGNVHSARFSWRCNSSLRSLGVKIRRVVVSLLHVRCLKKTKTGKTNQDSQL